MNIQIGIGMYLLEDAMSQYSEYGHNFMQEVFGVHHLFICSKEFTN